MYIVRDIFRLKFGHFKPVKAMMQDALDKGIMPKAESTRVLSDFTGHSYRLIFETGFNSLADFEKELTSDMAKPEWQEWYKKFVEHVDGSYREILKEMR